MVAKLTAAVGPEGKVPSELLSRLVEEEGLSLPQILCASVGIAKTFARAPISGYSVGAVALAEATGAGVGDLYLGANLEVAGTSPVFTLHAEQAAVNQAWLDGACGLAAVATSSPPCGYCRQFLWELGADLRIVVCGGDGPLQPAALAKLMPDAFSPEALGRTGHLLRPPAAGDRAPPPAPDGDPLLALALDAMALSYAPYTGGQSGCAIELADGTRWAGRYAENAAYNPALLPLTGALSAMRFGAGDRGGDPRIRRVVLAERTARTSQLATVSALLDQVAPGVEIERHVIDAGPEPG